MKSSVIYFTSILLIFIALNVSATGPAHNKVVVCYLSSWAVYRPGKGSYAIEHFEPDLCTHVIYAFSGLDNITDTIKSLDPWQDLEDDYGKGGYTRLTALKKTHPHLKVTLAIGGWNEGSINYSNMAADPNKRKRFVTQASQFVRKYNFDGLDLDWEYPSQRGGAPKDRENFVHLVRELREELNKHNLLLTSAFGAAKKTIDPAYDVKSLAKLFDFMHIMCYDYGGSWDKRVGANAPLTDSTDLNIEFTIDYFIKMGAPPSKLVLGIPFYGRTFVATGLGDMGDSSDATGFPGPYTRENGFMGYNEVCESIHNDTHTFTKSWHAETSQAIIRHKVMATGSTQVVTYDSTRSVANKMRYSVRKELAGVMIWSIDTDDFLGECEHSEDTFADFTNQPGITLSIPKRVYNNYPLLRTVNEALIVSIDEFEQEKELKLREKENEIPDDDDEKNKKNNSISLKIYSKYFLILTIVLIFIKN